MSSCRCAIIGISGYGRVHLGLAREAAGSGLTIDAAVVINPVEEAENIRLLTAGGCRIYDRYETMLERERGKIDLCLIPTGIAWHTRMTVAALRAGMNVLVEKPLAASVDEVRAIQAASAETGRWVAVGFQDIYDPAAHELKRRLLAGLIGQVQGVRFLGLWPRPAGYFTRNAWAGRLAADGAPVLDSVLNNAFAHFVNLSLFLVGPTFAEAAQADRVEAVLWRTNPIESFDTGMVRALTPQGVRLWFGATHACATTREPEIVIEGETGRVVWHHEREWVLERAGQAAERHPVGPTNTSRTAMMRDVVRRLDRADTFVCTPEIALRHTELIARIHAGGRIEAAPGPVEPQPVGPGGEPVLCSPEATRLLQECFAAGSLPASSLSR